MHSNIQIAQTEPVSNSGSRCAAAHRPVDYFFVPFLRFETNEQ
jgi:hypothetical protein